MADDPPDKPKQDPRDIVTPFTTSGQFAGLARETLGAGTGVMYVAGLARETLMAGIGLDGTGHASSSLRATLSLSSGSVVLGGHITGTSRARQTPLTATNLAGRVKGTLAARTAYTVRVSLGGRIVSEGQGAIELPGVKPGDGRATAQSSLRATLGIRFSARVSGTSRARIGQLPTRTNVAGRIAGRSEGRLFFPAPLALAGRVGGRSRGRLYFAPQAAARRSEAVSLNVGG
jgi:hypothetical protein